MTPEPHAIGKGIVLGRAPRNQYEPLDQIRKENVVPHRKIDSDIWRSDRDDALQLGGPFGRGGPLRVPRVGSTPHRDFSTAERLGRKPANDVATISATLQERRERAVRI